VIVVMRARDVLFILAGWCASAGIVPRSFAETEVSWRLLQPGVEYAVVDSHVHGSLPIDGNLHVVRVDPVRAPLKAVMAGAIDGHPRPAMQWCRDQGLAVAVNMGMYRDDRRTNSGYARTSGYVNNRRWITKYKTALAFDPTKDLAPKVLMADLDDPHDRERLAGYQTVVQNLRLIRAPGQGVWGQQDRRWSEAAVAVDKGNRVLFIFSRYPHSMKELNDILLSLPLGITTAMHVEGGPEASLSIHTGGVDLDLNGSYESDFNENDGEHRQWPIPNVLGVQRR
jgi:hypothetical protein